MHPLRLVAAVFTIAHASAEAHDPFAQWEGLFVVPSSATAKTSPEGPAVKVKGATDCLVIKRVAPNRAEVYLASVQALGYACYLEGTATLVEGRLEFTNEDAIAVAPGERAYLYVSAGVIRVGSSKPGAVRCGVHAGTEGIAFPAKSRRPLPAASSASGAELSSACPKWPPP